MSEFELMQATAGELISLASRQGIDLASMSDGSSFLREPRIMWFWRNHGAIRYSLQGRVEALPQAYQASAGAFHGMWHETGSLASLEEALALLKAWLIDRKDADDLPPRSVRSTGIG